MADNNEKKETAEKRVVKMLKLESEVFESTALENQFLKNLKVVPCLSVYHFLNAKKAYKNADLEDVYSGTQAPSGHIYDYKDPESFVSDLYKFVPETENLNLPFIFKDENEEVKSSMSIAERINKQFFRFSVMTRTEELERYVDFLVSRKVDLTLLKEQIPLFVLNSKKRKLLLFARESPESLFHRDCFPLDLLKIVFWLL